MALPGSTKYKVGLVFDIERTGFMRGLREINTKVEESRNKMQRNYGAISQSITNVGQKFMVATAAIVGFGAMAVKTAADFERAMNRVGAVSGATEEQLAALTDQAKELGRTTQFSASQAADAMGFLAMAGFEVNDIMGAMPSTLQLAASAQMDLAQAADITSNILTGYRMTVEELEHANDVLVKTFISTNTNLAQLGEAMKYAAPIAASAGIQFEEASAAIGLMGNAGIQASLAGTSLRGAIVRLLTPGGEAASVMEELGLQVLDATGNLLPLVDIVEQLERSGATTADMMTIFGLRAGPAFAALVSQGSVALRELIVELENSGGTAERIAEKQMEGLHGQLLKLKSAFEGFMIALADSGLIQWVTDTATKITEWVSAMAKYDKQTLKTIIVVGALVAAIGPLLIILGQIIMIAPAVGTAVTFMFGPWGLVIAGAVTALILVTKHINAVTVAIRAEMDALNAEIDAINESIDAHDEMREEVIDLNTEIENLSEETDIAAGTFDTLNDRIIKVIDAYPKLTEQMGYSLTATGELYDKSGDLVDTIEDQQRLFDAFSSASIVGEIDRLTTAERTLMEAVRERARVQAKEEFFAEKGGFAGWFNRLIGLGEWQKEGMEQAYGGNAFEEWLRENYPHLATPQPWLDAPPTVTPTAPIPVVIEDDGEDGRTSTGRAATDATEDNTEAVISLEDEMAQLREAFFEVPDLIFRGMTTGADIAFGDFLRDAIEAFRDSEPPKPVTEFDFADPFRPAAMGGNVIDKISDFFVDFTDAMENGLMDMEKQLYNVVGQFAADLVSGDVGTAIRGAFAGLANYIASAVQQSVSASIGGGGMFAGIAGAAIGGAVGAGVAILGSLLFPAKQPGFSKELPIYASITNWNEQNLGSFLPFSFMMSGRAGEFDVDYRGASLDRMRQGRRLGFHYMQ